MMVMVIVHSLPFHNHFLVMSIIFSDGVENFNKTIHFRSFSIFHHTNFDHVLNFLLLELGLPLLCVLFVPVKVFSNTIVSISCITVWIVNSIKKNEKKLCTYSCFCLVPAPMIWMDWLD